MKLKHNVRDEAGYWGCSSRIKYRSLFTPREVLELQEVHGLALKHRQTEKILQTVKKEQANAYSRSLSGGMRRRLLIAEASS